MRLPNAHIAIVDREKIDEYLLNLRHRYGASFAKGIWFGKHARRGIFNPLATASGSVTSVARFAGLRKLMLT